MDNGTEPLLRVAALGRLFLFDGNFIHKGFRMPVSQ